MFIACASNKQDQNIIGTWETVNNSVRGEFKFDSSGYVTMIQGSNVTGGKKEFMKDERLTTFTYTVNYKSDPMSVDLILTDVETKREYPRRILGIFEFIGNNEMKLCLNFVGVRPSSWIETKDQKVVNLTRKN